MGSVEGRRGGGGPRGGGAISSVYQSLCLLNGGARSSLSQLCPRPRCYSPGTPTRVHAAATPHTRLHKPAYYFGDGHGPLHSHLICYIYSPSGSSHSTEADYRRGLGSVPFLLVTTLQNHASENSKERALGLVQACCFFFKVHINLPPSPQSITALGGHWNRYKIPHYSIPSHITLKDIPRGIQKSYLQGTRPT